MNEESVDLSYSNRISNASKNREVERVLRELTSLTKKAEIPAQLVGKFIGRGGDNVRMLKETSGAAVNVRIEPGSIRGSSPADVMISGGVEAVVRCMGLVKAAFEADASGETPVGIPNEEVSEK